MSRIPRPSRRASGATAAGPGPDVERRVDLRASWAGLTPRGGSFLSAGAVALACALLLRQIDLVRIAVLLLALPLVLVVRMALLSLHVTVRREPSPRHATAGEPVSVSVHLDNRGRRRTPVLLMEDAVPDNLDVTARVVAPPLPPGATARVSYSVVPRRRGRFVLGPARVHAVEPFGMLERTWRAAATDELLVRPPTLALDPPLRPSARGDGGGSTHSGIVSAGEVDTTVREYREGDDLRRVHWPTTARRGALMVRRDERPHDLRVAVVLDRRRGAHAPGDPSPSFEWAVVAAASLAVSGADSRHGVTLLLDDAASAATDAGTALDRLAVADLGAEESLTASLAALEGLRPTTVVAVLGDLGPGLVGALGRTAREATRIALCLDVSRAPGAGAAGATAFPHPSVAAGSVRSPVPAAGPAPTPGAQAVQARHRASLAGLRAAGWEAVGVTPASDLRAVWSVLSQGTGRS